MNEQELREQIAKDIEAEKDKYLGVLVDDPSLRHVLLSIYDNCAAIARGQK